MELNYKVVGQGPPVVILHGLFGMLDNWKTIARRLSDEYSVYLVDQRNHGKSPHTSEFSYAHMAEDLNRFLNDNWIHHSILIGHSMGGKTAMYFTQQFPEMVEKLVVVDMGVEANPPGHEEIFDALLAVDFNGVKQRKDVDLFLQERIEEQAVRQFLMKNLTRNPEGVYRWKMNLRAIHENYHHVLEGIPPSPTAEQPTLFMKGEHSDYLEQGDLGVIQTIFPNASMDTIPGAGHWIHAEAPDAFLESLHAFIR